MSILRKSEKENVSWPKATPFLAAALVILTYCLTAFTGLKHTIPGYPSVESRQEAIDNMAKVDSLEKVIDMWSSQMSGILRIAEGQDPTVATTDQARTADTTVNASMARKDTLLVETVRKLDKPVVKQQNGTDK